MSRDTGVVIAAAGLGLRFKDRKQFLVLAGRPLLHYSLDVYASVEDVAEIVVVVHEADRSMGEDVVRSWKGPRDVPVRVTTGGARRQDSVLRGIGALESSRYVLVHDAARPVVHERDVERVLAEVKKSGAAVIGYQSPDSLKRVEGGAILDEIDRSQVWSVQTPQGAEIELLRRAYSVAEGRECTDEASLLRAAGIPVTLVEGPRGNIKITRPGDERLVEQLLRGRRS